MSFTKQPVVFCDFDGTITVNDNIVAIIQHFDPPGWKPIVDDIIGERKSIRQGVGELFQLLPTSRREEITRFAIDQVQIRAGFKEFLQFCQENDMKFYVTSGGIDFFIYPILGAFDIPKDHIYCNASDFTGTHIEILWPHSCDEICQNDCGMCKTRIIRSFDPEHYDRYLIGDSVTDFAGAKLVDHVYARSHLITKCEQLGMPHVPYTDFFDIINHMTDRKAGVQA